MIIVIDGPSGAGKSTLAKKLSDEYGIPYFDTGAMYRSFCWFLLDQGIDVSDEESVRKALEVLNFEIQKGQEGLRYFVNGQDVTKKIRQEEITKNVSKVSAYLFVRKYLVSIQRKFAQDSVGIFEGRDMGSVVFPKADIKFFLYADPNIRALRRFDQLKENFPGKTFDKNQILKDIIRRDEYDSKRKHSPLVQTEDAILVDVSYLSLDEVFEKLKSSINHKIVKDEI